MAGHAKIRLFPVNRWVSSDSERDVAAVRGSLGSVLRTIIAPIIPQLYILPRSKGALFEGDNTGELKDVLPDYTSSFLGIVYANLREIEHKFFVDIATTEGGTYMGHRKLTAIFVTTEGVPVPGKKVEWSREAGSADLRFLSANNTLKEELKGADAVSTDENGMAEVTIAHPARSVSEADAFLKIKAETEGKNANTLLRITRNDSVEAIDKIARKTATHADDLWVYQPDAAGRTPRNAGLREMQDILNEVVSRHRGINGFNWVRRDGVYGDDIKNAVKLYLEKFKTIQGGAHPYNLLNIGTSEHLKNYIKTEYKPFDPATAQCKGWIIDRRLLIGDAWDLTIGNIDGLLEIHEAVVKRLRDAVREYGQTYLDSSEFWMHRPIHQPYQPAADHVFACHTNGVTLRLGHSDTAAALTSNGTPVVINDGDHFLVSQDAAGWVEVSHVAGAGWVRKNLGKIVGNDRGKFRAPGTQSRNHGVLGNAGGGYGQEHTLNGVAYTFGGKQTPEEWRNMINTNPHADPMRIVHCDEYEAGHCFGGTQAELTAGNSAYRDGGCDCAGFVQNCVTHACYDGTATGIVPAAIMPANTWLHSSAFVGNALCARPVPAVQDDDTHYVRGGDIIYRPGHIVMVAEDEPDLLNDNTDFMIMQEYGVTDATDTTRFRRKSVRSQFSWWGNTQAGFSFGKLFIWA